MIDEYSTFLCFGYISDDLSFASHKMVLAICDKCGTIRFLRFQDYRKLCKSCTLVERNISKKHKKMVSKFHTGKKRSEETRYKMSKNHADVSRDKNPMWKSDKTDEERIQERKYPKYYEWRTSVYQRDDFMCQKCNSYGKLNAHHIESYNSNKELRTTLSNGITLCKECHKDFHHQYGYGNNTKEQFIEFIGSN